MTIGQRIRKRREELHLSQDELAKRIGYKSRSSINKIELDLYNLKQSKIKAIADALDTTPAYIMGWDDKKTPIPETEDGRINLYELDDMTAESIQLLLALPEEKQQDAGSYIRFLAKSEDK